MCGGYTWRPCADALWGCTHGGRVYTPTEHLHLGAVGVGRAAVPPAPRPQPPTSDPQPSALDPRSKTPDPRQPCWCQHRLLSSQKGTQTPLAPGRSTKIISMIRWIRTSRLPIKNSLSLFLTVNFFWSTGPSVISVYQYTWWYITLRRCPLCILCSRCTPPPSRKGMHGWRVGFDPQ